MTPAKPPNEIEIMELHENQNPKLLETKVTVLLMEPTAIRNPQSVIRNP